MCTVLRPPPTFLILSNSPSREEDIEMDEGGGGEMGVVISPFISFYSFLLSLPLGKWWEMGVLPHHIRPRKRKIRGAGAILDFSKTAE